MMPSGLLQKTLSVNGGASTSLIRFPATGRKTGRIDSILFAVEYTGSFSGAPAWVKDSRIKLFVDKPNSPIQRLPGLTFERAYYFTKDMGNIKMHQGVSDNWAIAILDLGIFSYYFEIQAYNADGSAHEFHVTVMFEEF